MPLRKQSPSEQLTSSESPRRRITALALMAGILMLSGVSAVVISNSAPDTSPAEAATSSGNSAAPAQVDSQNIRTLTATEPTSGAFVAIDLSRAGIAVYNSGDVAGSIEQFKTAVDADPQNAEALNNLGQALVRAGRASEAVPYFDRAVGIASGVWAYHFNRARALAQLEQWPTATAGYRDAARLFPDDYVTQFNLAKALQANGAFDEAAAGFQRAIELAPGQPDFHLSHGLALEAAGRRADAAAAYRRYLGLQDEAPDAEKIKARIARLEGTQT